MFINDVKKSTPIRMTHGRVGYMMDNKKGNIRMVQVTNGVNGSEIGSVYVKDIIAVQRTLESGVTVWVGVNYSPAQRKAAGLISAAGF